MANQMVCDMCGKPARYKIMPLDIKTGQGEFCSGACVQNWQDKQDSEQEQRDADDEEAHKQYLKNVQAQEKAVQRESRWSPFRRH